MHLLSSIQSQGDGSTRSFFLADSRLIKQANTGVETRSEGLRSSGGEYCYLEVKDLLGVGVGVHDLLKATFEFSSQFCLTGSSCLHRGVGTQFQIDFN